MSEYRYYEFAAIERPLTKSEMTKLRAVSTRGIITPTSFSNHYDWGGLKAKPSDWIRQYFDAFVYWADWCSCQLLLRFPKSAFTKAALQPFANQSSFSITSNRTHWILDWWIEESEDYDRFADDDGSGWMRRLIPLRDELLRGDLRALYLGWLAGVGSLPDDVLEPEVPPGLADLTPAQKALVEFLEINPDWLQAACTGRPDITLSGADEKKRMASWLETWTPAGMKEVLKHIALEHEQAAVRRVKLHYADWVKAQHPVLSDSPRLRISELRKLAQSAAAIRHKREARARALREAKRQREHEARLRALMKQPDKVWQQADAHAARGTASSYDQAAKILAELAQAYALASRQDTFDRKLRQFLIPHAKRGALLLRLDHARFQRS